MASDDYFFEDHNPYGWDDAAEGMLEGMGRYQSFMNDDMSMWLIDAAFFNEDISTADRAMAREWISEYWEEHWGYDFMEEFDWDAWREYMGY